MSVPPSDVHVGHGGEGKEKISTSTGSDEGITREHPQLAQPVLTAQPLSSSSAYAKPSRSGSIFAKLRSHSGHSQAPLHKAMQSVTSKLPVAPPPMDMSEVLAALAKGGNTADTHTPVGAFLRVLRGRFASKHSTVVLKSCLLVHAVIRAGNDALVRYLSKHHGGLLDAPVKGESRESLFLRAYAPYVKHWLAVRERCTWFARGMSGPVPAIWDKMHLSKIMDEIEGILGVIQKAADIEGAGEMEVIRVCLTMTLHDCWKLSEMLREGVDRMVDQIYSCGYEASGRGLELYRRVVDVGGRMAHRAEEWEWVEGRWKVAELLRFDEKTGDDIQRYIEEGCEGARPWLRSARRLAAGEVQIGAMDEIQKVVEGESVDEEEVNEVVRVLVAGIGTGDWRVGLRCVGALVRLVEKEKGGVVEELMHRGRQGELSVGDIDTSVKDWEHGGERMKWGLGYLERMVGWKVVRLESKGKGNKGVVEEVEMLVEVMKWMDQVDMNEEEEEEIRNSVQRCCGEVFSELVQKGNELVGEFWEIGEVDDTERALEAYEGLVRVKGEVEREGGLFGKMKQRDDGFRRPQEVVGRTDIVQEMRRWMDERRQEPAQDGIEKRLP